MYRILKYCETSLENSEMILEIKTNKQKLICKNIN